MEDKFAAVGAGPQLKVETQTDSVGVRRTFTTADGVEHFARVWKSDTAVQPEKAVLVYIHGIEGHSLWFDRTAKVLTAQGISTYAIDRRGAGLSQEERGHCEHHRRLVADIDEIVCAIGDIEAGRPVFLMANCWGAKPAIVAAASPVLGTSRRISGLILTSPAITVQVDVDFLTKLKIGWSYLKRDNKPFPIPLTPEHFTENPRYLQFIREDKLRLKNATASFFLHSLILTRLAQSAATILSTPLLVLQSGRDGIVVIDQIEKWFSQVASKDKTMEMFPEAAHSLDFEEGSAFDRYEKTLGRWMMERAR